MNTLLPIADRLIARRNFRFPQQGGTHAPGGSQLALVTLSR
jgi:hypothetical protein